MRITITGADEKTPISSLVEIVNAYPLVEIGLLYSATPEGRNRYPRLEWIKDVVAALPDRCALHVCGSKALVELLNGDLDEVTRLTPRVQVNGRLGRSVVEHVSPRVRYVITQHCPANLDLVSVDVKNHSLLIDSSGGRGVTPREWSRPWGVKSVGFAGGLGPDNLTQELAKIVNLADADSWIDMEGKLRTDDWFDLDKARDVLDTFHYYGVAAR